MPAFTRLAVRVSVAPRFLLRACGVLAAAAALAACGDVTAPRPAARAAAQGRPAADVTPDSGQARGDTTSSTQQEGRLIWW